MHCRAPLVTEGFCFQNGNWEVQVQTPVALVDLAVRSFPGFLRNSRKYGLGCLRKTPTEGILPVSPDLISRQLALMLQPTKCIVMCNDTKLIY